MLHLERDTGVALMMERCDSVIVQVSRRRRDVMRQWRCLRGRWNPLGLLEVNALSYVQEIPLEVALRVLKHSQ